jgi:hypothetical protein
MRNLTMRNLTVSGIVLDLSADGMEFLLLHAGLYSRQTKLGGAILRIEEQLPTNARRIEKSILVAAI